MINYLDEYAELFGYKKDEVSIKVFEGLRDLKTQEKLFKDKLKEIKLNNPNLSDEQTELETSNGLHLIKIMFHHIRPVLQLI